MKTAKAAAVKTAPVSLKPTLWQDIRRNKWLVLLCVPAIVFFIIFASQKQSTLCPPSMKQPAAQTEI